MVYLVGCLCRVDDWGALRMLFLSIGDGMRQYDANYAQISSIYNYDRYETCSNVWKGDLATDKR